MLTWGLGSIVSHVSHVLEGLQASEHLSKVHQLVDFPIWAQEPVKEPHHLNKDRNFKVAPESTQPGSLEDVQVPPLEKSASCLPGPVWEGTVRLCSDFPKLQGVGSGHGDPMNNTACQSVNGGLWCAFSLHVSLPF